MRPEGAWEKERWLADTLVILAIVYLASGTWSHASPAGGMAVWKSYVAVLMSVFLALAALTRHPDWCVRFRFLLGLWIVAAPFLLRFAEIVPATRAYLLTGALIAATAIPRFRTHWAHCYMRWGWALGMATSRAALRDVDALTGPSSAAD